MTERDLPVMVNPIGNDEQPKGILDAGLHGRLILLLQGPFGGTVLAFVKVDSTSVGSVK